MMAGVGLDARIVHELDLDLKRKLGKLAYWHGGLGQMGRAMPKLRIVVNGVERIAALRCWHACGITAGISKSPETSG